VWPGPGDVIATTETEPDLKDLDTDASITPMREGDLLITWGIVSTRSNLQDLIIPMKGVRHVDRNIDPHAPAITEVTEIRQSSKFPRQGAAWKSWNCILLSDATTTTSPQFAQDGVEYNMGGWGFKLTCGDLVNRVRTLKMSGEIEN
jgi:hypothetical protein